MDLNNFTDETEEEEKILVFAKISSYEGLENINSILKVADGIVIEKNDLCLEIFPEKMFIAQKEIIGKCNRVSGFKKRERKLQKEIYFRYIKNTS